MQTRVVVSHSGRQHAYRHALALQRLDRLHRFVTSTYYAPSRWPDRLVARLPRIDAMLRRRHLDGLEARVIRRPSLEVPEVLCRSAVGNGRLAQMLVLQRDVLFDRWVAQAVLPRAAPSAGVFWGFQGSCRNSLLAAKSCGMTGVVELATGHVPAAERILGMERERHPEWADSISNAGFPGWYVRRLNEEVGHADFCVAASSFTRGTLLEAGVRDDRILTLPLGVDLEKFAFVRRSEDGPFQVLFVGGVGQRKGIKYLLDAYRRLKGPAFRLTVVGPMIGGGRAFRENARGVEYVGRADEDTVIRRMQRSHVLVLPSVFEGFGLVIVEAMATGMPVIASTHSAAPDIIREGIDGYVLAPDDVDGLADRLAHLARHRRLAVRMGLEAAGRAREFGWDRHAERLAQICRMLEKEASGNEQTRSC